MNTFYITFKLFFIIFDVSLPSSGIVHKDFDCLGKTC